MFNQLKSRFLKENPSLQGLEPQLVQAFSVLEESLTGGGTVFTCGNGGSAADAEHIVGELLKSFAFNRPIAETDAQALAKLFPAQSKELVANLEAPLRAVALTSAMSFQSAFANDVGYEHALAQHLYALGNPGDVLIAISTSGNSKNVLAACQVAKLKNIKVIGLSGATGGKLRALCDVSLNVPSDKTHKIQELHLPVYHFLCYALEAHFFGEHGARYDLTGSETDVSAPELAGKQDFSQIRTIVFDFDGVMTDNKVYVAQDGTETVSCDRADGLGVKQLQRKGYSVVVLSTEANPVVGARANKLGIECHQDCGDKQNFLETYCDINNLNAGELAYIGNDINDLEAMKFAGYSFCPADAHPSVKAMADRVLLRRGGDQVVREVADLLGANG